MKQGLSPKMAHSVRYDARGGFVCTSVTGDMQPDVVETVARAAAELARSAGANRFLFDVTRARTSASITDIYHFMSDLERLGYRRDDWVAVAFRHDADDHEFAALVAHNRGWARVAYFPRLADARRWLAERPEPSRESA